MALTENELINLLGTMTDYELSQKTGIHVSDIFRIREELDIYAFNENLQRPGSRRERRIYWTPEMDSQLGKDTDRGVSDELGVSPDAVGQRRNKLGIPTYNKIDWTPEMNTTLGTMTDQNVADLFGISQQAVWQQRHKLGISASSPRGRGRRR